MENIDLGKKWAKILKEIYEKLYTMYDEIKKGSN